MNSTIVLFCYITVNLKYNYYYYYYYCNQFRTPVELYLDEGSSVNPQPGSELWERYFHGERCTVHQVASSHQHLNFCERTVSIISRLLRTSFLQREKLHFPSLTFCELSTLLSTVITLLNSRPIFATASGSQVITPNHLIRTHAFQQNPQDADTALSSLQMNFHNFYSQLKMTHSIFVNIVKSAFKSNLATTHFLGVGKKAIFLTGDFVLIFGTDKLACGLVVEPGPQYSVVKTAETNPPALANIHCNKLLLLHRESKPESDNLPVMDMREGTEKSSFSTACYTQSFLVFPSKKFLKQKHGFLFLEAKRCYSACIQQILNQTESAAVNIQPIQQIFNQAETGAVNN